MVGEAGEDDGLLDDESNAFFVPTSFRDEAISDAVLEAAVVVGRIILVCLSRIGF